MLSESLPFVKTYLELLDQSLNTLGGRLTKTQKFWLGFCITAIIFTNNISWKAWERWSGGKYSDGALSRMFRKATIPWSLLLMASTKLILKRYGISEGVLAIDDSDHQRSKNTKKIGYVHRIKDKKNDGYYQGQNLVFLNLITSSITIPVGFRFYMPDPKIQKWNKMEKELKKQKVKKKDRPAKPAYNKEYPSKLQIAFELVESFLNNFSEINIKCVVADALYGSAEFVDKTSKLRHGLQVISQLHSNQLIKNNRGLLVDVKSHFKNAKTEKKKILIRGGKEETVICCSQKVYIECHGVKRTIIAIKYSDEKEFRYIIATNMTWLDTNIIQAYTLRWFIEVFFQDWKTHEGWSNLAKQQGVEGSSRSVILSLLLDHSFFLHKDQQFCIENKLPLKTIGSLIETSRLDIIWSRMSTLMISDNPGEDIKLLELELKNVISLRTSKKHMSSLAFENIFQNAA